MIATALTPDELEEALRAHARQYHSEHPFHQRMNEGLSTRDELRRWVANRFYYQENIPRKDGAILSSLPDREIRRRWVQRIVDHDGTVEGGGRTAAVPRCSPPTARPADRGTPTNRWSRWTPTARW